eukprot:6460663-Amphidinium_carterae.1
MRGKTSCSSTVGPSNGSKLSKIWWLSDILFFSGGVERITGDQGLDLDLARSTRWCSASSDVEEGHKQVVTCSPDVLEQLSVSPTDQVLPGQLVPKGVLRDNTSAVFGQAGTCSALNQRASGSCPVCPHLLPSGFGVVRQELHAPFFDHALWLTEALAGKDAEGGTLSSNQSVGGLLDGGTVKLLRRRRRRGSRLLPRSAPKLL